MKTLLYLLESVSRLLGISGSQQGSIAIEADRRFHQYHISVTIHVHVFRLCRKTPDPNSQMCYDPNPTSLAAVDDLQARSIPAHRLLGRPHSNGDLQPVKCRHSGTATNCGISNIKNGQHHHPPAYILRSRCSRQLHDTHHSMANRDLARHAL